MNEIRVNQVFPITNGLFSHMEINDSDFGVISRDDLDLLLVSKCGKRLITPIVEMLLDDNEKLTDTSLTRLGKLIVLEYGETWRRIRESLSIEYNPLKNSVYSETETTNMDGESGETGKEISKNDITSFDVDPDNYASAGKTTNDINNTTNNHQSVKRTLERTSNGTGYSGSELVQSEINMRIANRFTERVLNDVKNYIAMEVY